MEKAEAATLVTVLKIFRTITEIFRHSTTIIRVFPITVVGLSKFSLPCVKMQPNYCNLHQITILRVILTQYVTAIKKNFSAYLLPAHACSSIYHTGFSPFWILNWGFLLPFSTIDDKSNIHWLSFYGRDKIAVSCGLLLVFSSLFSSGFICFSIA